MNVKFGVKNLNLKMGLPFLFFFYRLDNACHKLQNLNIYSYIIKMKRRRVELEKIKKKNAKIES